MLPGVTFRPRGRKNLSLAPEIAAESRHRALPTPTTRRYIVRYARLRGEWEPPRGVGLWGMARRGRRLGLLLATSSTAALLTGGGAPAFAACYTGPFPFTNSTA